jgi:hypothetical protein
MKFFNKHGVCATEAYAHHAGTDWEARCCDVEGIASPKNFKTRKTVHLQTTKYNCSGPLVEKHCSKS